MKGVVGPGKGGTKVFENPRKLVPTSTVGRGLVFWLTMVFLDLKNIHSDSSWMGFPRRPGRNKRNDFYGKFVLFQYFTKERFMNPISI